MHYCLILSALADFREVVQELTSRKRIVRAMLAAVAAISALLVAGVVAAGQRPAKQQVSGQADSPAPGHHKARQPVPLNAKKTVLLDKPGNRLLLKTQVVLRAGLLEMLCCLKHTKEHESILALDAKAYVVHAGLLALGARPGRPVQYVPEYRPPSGQRIDLFVRWRDRKGVEHRERAQRWVRYARYRFHVAKLKALPPEVKLPEDSPLRFDARNQELTWYGPMTKKERDELLALTDAPAFRDAINRFYQQSLPREMDTHWVFVGSGFYKDPETGEKYYMAEGGDLICVANFPSATLDVAIPSTSSGTENLLFEAYTERIPPVGTEVLLELIPSKITKKPDIPGKKASSDKPR